MIDSAIITVKDKYGSEIGDFEVPVRIPIKEFCEKMGEILKSINSDKYFGIFDIKIIYNNKILDDDATLYSYGIWDGSIVILKYKEV